jgi:tetratricopeptide (TPR) repeat protein
MSDSSKKSNLPRAFAPVLSAGIVAAFAYALWPDSPPPPPPSPAQPAPAGQPVAVALPGADAPFDEWVRAANQLMDHGAFPAAIKGYTEALARDSSVAEVWVDRGACRHALGDYDGAETDFRYAMRLNPEHVTAHFNLGIVFYSSGKSDSARAYWEWVRDKAPNSNEASRAQSLLAQLESDPG